MGMPVDLFDAIWGEEWLEYSSDQSVDSEGGVVGSSA